MKKKLLVILSSVLAILVGIYLLLVFSQIPFIAKWRTIYIETAMTTNSHQWLATLFIPQSVIDEVMWEREMQETNQKQLESSWADSSDEALQNTVIPAETESETEPSIEPSAEEKFYADYPMLDNPSFRSYLAAHPILTTAGYDRIEITNIYGTDDVTTTQGDQLLALDVANNTMIIGITGDGYVGKLAIVKNMDQVTLKTSDYLGSRGELASAYSEKYDAEVVINAGGFKDAGGHGNGGVIKGSCVLDGEEYGSAMNSYWKFAGIKYDNKMYVSNRYSTDISEYRWGIEFFPALIVDGQSVIDGSYGMGIQPRTAIAQTQEGDFLMLVVDGRQVGYSLGCTVSDCNDILLKYGAYQAMNLDGGSSSVMYYKNQMLTKPSSVSGVGRYMPNAIVIEKQKAAESSHQ